MIKTRPAQNREQSRKQAKKSKASGKKWVVNRKDRVHISIAKINDERRSMQAHQPEVLVAGAGPVGMVAALYLAEGGIHTRVIDQESGTAGHSYACALHPHTLRVLDGLGLAEQAISLGWRINAVVFYSGGARRAELKLNELTADFPFVLVLEQARLEQMLAEKLAQRGISVEWHHRLADLAMDSGGVTATIEKLAPTAKGYIVPEFELSVQKAAQTRTAFVVGADGHNSLVRTKLNIPFDEAGERELFAVYEVESDGGFDHEMKIVLDRGSASVMWPFAKDRCRWSFQLLPADAPTEFPEKDRTHFVVTDAAGEGDSRHQVQRLVRERAPWFQGNIREVDWRTIVQFEHRLAGRFGQDRCWLAGDAAHQTGPEGMQSMNAGIREATDLAIVLRRILREQGSLDLLPAYGARHRREWRDLLGLNGGPRLLNTASGWVRGNCARVAACLPASGPDLVALLNQFGLEPASAAGS